MDIKDFRKVVAQNIYYLRTENHMTQYELGEKLNYSDKAISKWERGDGLPDAYILSQMSQLFGVTVDYMLTPHSEQNQKVETQPIKKAKRLVNNIVTAGIFTLALIIFVLIAIGTGYGGEEIFYWQVFIYAIPVSAITRIVFVSVWEKARGVFLYSSILLWSLIATIYLAIGNYGLWIMFVIGIPLQLIVFLCFRIKIIIRFSKKRKNTKKTDAKDPHKENTLQE
ncbi:MAG: helix-turn-helix domain-containing protein [Clostridia bacterium]|nr:helix-turn-helix domain-containing protein [Clostridia bacterium]